MFYLVLVLFLLVGGALTALAIQNMETPVHLTLVMWQTPEISLGLLLVLVFLLGALVLYLVSWMSAMHDRKEMKRLGTRTQELEQQLAMSSARGPSGPLRTPSGGLSPLGGPAPAPMPGGPLPPTSGPVPTPGGPTANQGGPMPMPGFNVPVQMSPRMTAPPQNGGYAMPGMMRPQQSGGLSAQQPRQ